MKVVTNGKFLKWVIAIMLVVSMTTPIHSKAANELASDQGEGYFLVTSEASVTKVESDTIIGKLSQGNIVKAISESDTDIHFMFGKDEALISLDNTEAIGEYTGEIRTQESTQFMVPLTNIEVFSNEGVKLGEIYQGIEFPIYNTGQNEIEVLLGEQVGLVSLSDIEMVTDAPKDNEEAEEPTSEDKSEATTSIVDKPETTTTTEETTDKTFKLLDSAIRSFDVTQNNVSVYDNSTGQLVHVGYLTKGQNYPIQSIYSSDWFKIKYGSGSGFVWRGGVTPSSANPSSKNLNKGEPPGNRKVKGNQNLTVYDNSSGSLVQFGEITKDVEYPIIAEIGDWYKVDFAGRIGYIYKLATEKVFLKEDRYFTTTENNVSIYENRAGSLVHVGYLPINQTYPRISDMGDWHQIQYGSRIAYVWKDATKPATGTEIKNAIKTPFNTVGSVRTKEPVTVYDNSSGKLVAFGEISKDVEISIVSNLGDWYAVNFAGRLGYIYYSAVERSFSANDKYFTVKDSNVPVYKNENGRLVQIGSLLKGQEYIRDTDYGDWHRIKYGEEFGFVWKQGTRPSDGNQISNRNNKKPTKTQFITSQEVTVYENKNGQLLAFSVISPNAVLTVLEDYGDWYQVDVAGRLGFVYKSGLSPIIKDLVNPKQKYSYLTMQQDIRSLKAMYSDLIQYMSIGKSVDGREIYAVKIGKGTKEIFINGSHHAREHMTTNLLMEMIDQYALAYKNNGSMDGFNARQVLDRVSIWYVPMVNPDGVTLVQEGHYSAKNPYQVLMMNNFNTDFSSWKANIRGVDLNRQYPANWDTIRNNAARPGAKNFKGYAPLSEPEVQAVYNFTINHDFKTAVAYHSSGEILYWYFKQSGNPYWLDYGIASKISRKTGYSLVQPTSNPSGGGYTDWFIQSQGKPGFTPEISPYVVEQPVPLSNYDRIWNQNNSIGLMLADEAYYR